MRRMKHSHIASMHVAGHVCGCMVWTSPSICDRSYTSVMVNPAGGGVSARRPAARRYFSRLAKESRLSVRGQSVLHGACMLAVVQVEGAGDGEQAWERAHE